MRFSIVKLPKTEWGYLLMYLVIFVPNVYKLISPFFILAGLGTFTIYINSTIFLVGLIMARSDFFRRITLNDVGVYLFALLYIFMSSVLHPQTSLFFENNIIDFSLYVLPCLFIGLSINNNERHDTLLWVARIGIVVQVFWQVCQLTGLVERERAYDGSLGEQMELAYWLLFSLFILLVKAIREKGIGDILLSVLSVFLLLSCGTRGPIIVFTAFVIGYLLFFMHYERHNSFKKILIVVFSCVFYYFLDVVLLAILPLVEMLGFSTRVFSSILDNRMVNIQESSGRDEVYGNIIEAIKNDNGFGYGWGGDRLFVQDGAYAHNLELELLIQFGVIFGGIIIAIIFYLAIKSFSKTKLSRERDLWYIMLFVGIMELQLSKTYILHPPFFVCIGYFVGVIRNFKTFNNTLSYE